MGFSILKGFSPLPKLTPHPFYNTTTFTSAIWNVVSIQAILVLAMAFGPDVTRFGLLTCTNIHILLAQYLARQ